MHAWRDILRLSAEYLVQKGVPDAQVAAELLVARLLKCGRGFLSPHLDETPDPKYVEAMRRGIARLAAGEPVQYVLGEWDFRSLTLKCDSRALIPRPETEELGTGSGCIILSLAKEMADGIFLGLDISADAVSLAQENAARCGLAERVKFAVADGLDEFDEPETVDILVSNPPYIATADCSALDPRIRDWEPMNALDGGPAGLDFYERLIGDALNVLKPGGGVFFEIGDGQGESLRKLFFDAGFNDIRVEKDYAGHDRYASAVLSPGNAMPQEGQP